MKTFVEIHRELTHARNFGVILICPDCKAPLEGILCSSCKKTVKRNILIGHSVGYSFLIVLYWCLPVFFGVVGALVFHGIGGIVGFVLGSGAANVGIRDLRREKQMNRDSKAPEVLLAQRYQSDPATYDQAAACYLAWLTQGNIASPDGLADFLRRYRCRADALAEQRTALLNAVIAQICGQTNSDDLPWTRPLLDAAFTGTAEQKELLHSFLAAKATSGVNEIYILPFRQLISALETSHEKGRYMSGHRICPED
jgi:hypothetical protein